jgi:hypothetical protein
MIVLYACVHLSVLLFMALGLMGMPPHRWFGPTCYRRDEFTYHPTRHVAIVEKIR